MVAAVPVFYINVEWAIDVATAILTVVLLAWALINTITQRSDAFAAIGGLSKPAWLLILGVLLLIVGLLILPAILEKPGARVGFLGIFIWIGIGAAAYYLLETRRGLKDISEGPW